MFYTCTTNVKSLDLGESESDFARLFPTDVPKLDPETENIIQFFTQATYTRGLSVNPHPTDKRVAPLAWKSLSYTIHTIEMLLRDANKPLLGSLSSRHRDCLESFVRVIGVFGTTYDRVIVMNSHALHLLTILVEHGNEGPSILRWDPLGCLVPLTFALPSLFTRDGYTPIPTGGTLEWHELRLVFLAHIVKLLITFDLRKLGDEMETDDLIEQTENGTEKVLDMLFTLMNKRGWNGSMARSVWSHVQDACLPFLRCCILFYHYLTGELFDLNFT